MPRRSFTDDLSEEQIRILLGRKLRSARQDRLEHFRKTGRLVILAPEVSPPAFENFHYGCIS